jgi:nitrile hydratase accessory protein
MKGKMKTCASVEIITDAEDTVFAEPWEARAFAIALTLSGGKGFSWDEFRTRLIAEIAQADAVREPRDDVDTAPKYYECWLAALEKILREKALLGADDIDRRAAAIAASPPAPTKALSHGPIRIA